MKKLLLSLILFLTLVPLVEAQTTYKSWRQRTHATDCTIITDGKTADMCYEQDSQNVYVCDAVDGTCNTAIEWKLASSSGAGVGDVTSVGDCASGACNDGSNDGGTYIRLYDGDSHYGQYQTANLSADRTYTFPNESGTVCTTGSVCTGYQGTLTTGTLSATSPVSVSGARTVIGGAADISIANAAADGTTKGAAAFTAADFDATAGVVALDYTNAQAASSGSKGFLTSADWTTFNAKLASTSIDTSSELATILTDETGTGALVFANTPTFVTPVLGAASATSLTLSNALAFAYGGTGLTTAADDTVMVSSGSAWVAKAIADCQDTGGNHLNYNASTNAFSCGTSGGSSGWTDGGTTLYLTTTTDNVGIGTTAADASLEVVKQSSDEYLMLSATPSGNGDVMIVTSAGNVGIGSTIPGNKFVVGGDIQAGIGTTGTIKASSLLILSADNGSTSHLVITSAGNVGIGSTAPSQKLSVNGTIESISGGIKYPDGTTQTTAASGAGWTDGGTTVYLTTSGDNVGIGTTAATVKLDVRGAISATASGQSTFAQGIVLNNGGGATSSDDVQIKGDTDNNLVYVDASADNVGIGTSAPTAKLHVVGGATITGTINTALTASRCVETDGSGNLTVAASTCGSGGASGWTDGGSTLYVTTTTDNVGIGTTASDATLEIVKQSSDEYLMISATAAGNGDIMIVNSAGNVGIGTTTPRDLLEVGAGKLTVESAGNVGIGTINPTVLFEVNGTAKFSGAGNVGIGTTAPDSLLTVGSSGYMQFKSTAAGAPTAGDCDADAERGRLLIDTSNNRLYICNGASRAWDYIALTD